MNISDLIGKTIVNINGGLPGVKGEDWGLELDTSDGFRFEFSHEQDCCEHVYIEDVCGDLEDLLNSPILEAEEVTNKEVELEEIVKLGKEYDKEYDNENEYYEWTFYKFATKKGFVVVRWIGTSNGYYSVSVDLTVTKLGDTN